MFYVHLTISNIIIVSENNLEWSCLSTFNLERPLTEKLKFKHFDGVFGMLLLSGILKIRILILM